MHGISCFLLHLENEKVIQCLLFVCLFVQVQNNSKICNRVCMKFSGSVIIIDLEVHILPACGLPGWY